MKVTPSTGALWSPPPTPAPRKDTKTFSKGRKKDPGKGNQFHKDLRMFGELKIRTGELRVRLVPVREMMWCLLNNVKVWGPVFSFLFLKTFILKLSNYSNVVREHCS